MTDTTQADALRALIEQIEDGNGPGAQIVAKRMASEARNVGGTYPSHDIEKAFGGSLDAAKALHEALLPGWFWNRQGMVMTVTDDHTGWGNGHYARARDDDNPARAWLLAILRAKLAEVEA